MSEDLLFEIRDNIARITFNRPASRNALTFAMYERLERACEEIGGNRSVRAMIVSGAGDKAFAAGTDISEFRAFKTAEDALAYESRIGRVLGGIERLGVPVIAAINGACTGGGAGIAAACDMRLGTPTLRYGFPVARTLGNCLSMDNYARLAALIGPARLKEIIFTARFIGAEEARAIGLLNEVLPDGTALMARAEELATLMASHAPLTLRATKEALRRLVAKAAQNEDKDLIISCYTSRDFREGMEAFLNKRAPNWRGE